MVSKTHSVGALVGLSVAAIYFPQNCLSLATIIAALIAVEIGSLLPDIDQSSNRLWDLLPGGEFLGRIFRRLFLGHRSLSHSLIGLFLVAKLFSWLFPLLFNSQFIDPLIIYYSLIIGYLSHLILDSFTQEGLPLFFPLDWKIGLPPFKFLRLKSGHWPENWLVFPLLILILVWIIFTHWPLVKIC